MPAGPSRRLVNRSRLRACAAALAGASLLLSLGVSGAAATSSSHGHGVFPSAAQVRAAKARAAAAAAQVVSLQSRYQATAAHLVQLEQAVSDAAAAASAAEDDLAVRTQAENAALTRASAAAATATGARLTVRRYAAALYQQGQTLGQLGALLQSGSPQQYADTSAGIAALGARWSDDLAAATSSAAIDAAAQRTADLARAQQEAATRAAQQAEAAAQTEVAAAQAEAASLSAQQTAMVATLARLRHTSKALEQARQDGLAAAAARAAAARAAAARAARYGGSAIFSSGGSPSLTAAQLNPRAVAQRLMPAYGFGGSQWSCLDQLWNGESGWRWSADNPSSGAYGIPQSLPASKMGSVGPDWLTNPVTQIRWGLGYIRGAYGSPCRAWSAWLSRSPHWY